MQGIKNALKGVQYANPQLGERLYELCRKATSRHIDRPDEILNQQVLSWCELNIYICMLIDRQQLCCLLQTARTVFSWWVDGWVLLRDTLCTEP